MTQLLPAVSMRISMLLLAPLLRVSVYFLSDIRVLYIMDAQQLTETQPGAAQIQTLLENIRRAVKEHVHHLVH